MSSAHKHLLITQPYLPAYRVPLFTAIGELLAESAVSMTVAVGKPKGSQALRADSRDTEWSVPYSSREVSVRGRTIEFRRMPESIRSPDVVVSELQALNPFAWTTICRRVPLVLWGHGKSYVDAPSEIGDRLEWMLARRADHIMTYTGGGKDYLVRQGRMSGHRVTAIGNATDTGPIRAGFVAGLYDGYQIDAKVPRPRKALYVGGLDPSKRIDFLIAAARHAHFLDPNFELIVVGMGELSADVRSAQRDGVPISLIGEARGSELGKLGILADALWMPGRVGLAAIDAVAMGLIVHTTNYGFHAPEIELLNSDEVTFLPDDPRLFAEKSLSQMALRPAPHLRNLRKDAPTIESVSLAFTKVVLNVLRSRA